MGKKLKSAEMMFSLMILTLMVRRGEMTPTNITTTTSYERVSPEDTDGKGHVDVDTYDYSVTFNAFWAFVPIIFVLVFLIRKFCCRRKEARQETEISTVGVPYTGTTFNSPPQSDFASNPQYGGQYGLASQPQYGGYGGQYGLGVSSQPQASFNGQENQNSYYSYSNPAATSPGGFIQPP